jgi:hypothetical protein
MVPTSAEHRAHSWHTSIDEVLPMPKPDKGIDFIAYDDAGESFLLQK